ncbi:uncharacterized protein LOC132553260 [Ylistrum balloti]|uniref:uncharacterized protein LOC132553260 n=1 Tax=Ylistrum balloti TaxID=509963 RepID=UPI002905D154|nr:uncharacterized protein LOC132553260 [Ylistrum balloti]
MAPKRKLEEEDGDASAGSAGEEKQDDGVDTATTQTTTPVKKARGRPRKSDSDKKAYTPTGNPRGRPRMKVPERETESGTLKKRGRSSVVSKTGTDSEVDRTPSQKKQGRPSLPSKVGTTSDVQKATSPSPKKRGRPSLASKITTGNNERNQPSNQPRKRGRPPVPSKKSGEVKAADNSRSVPSGRPRGRPPLGENGANNSRSVPSGKPRGRPPLGENGAKKTTTYVPTGKPRGRPPLGENGIQVKRKYFKKEKYRLQAKSFKIRRAKFNPIPTERKSLTVKPLKTDSVKNKSVTNTSTVPSNEKQNRCPSIVASDVNNRACLSNPRIYNVTPTKRSNVQFPVLNEFQRSLLHVNHSKTFLNYESDCEPALDVLQKKLLAVNTQLIDTEEQKLELDKRIIIIKQRKIELERQLLNYQPQRRVLTRVERVPVIDMVNDQQSDIEHGAKILGWVAVEKNIKKDPTARSTSWNNYERFPDNQSSGPQHSRERAKKEVKKPKKVTSRTEKRGRGRPRKQE